MVLTYPRELFNQEKHWTKALEMFSNGEDENAAKQFQTLICVDNSLNLDTTDRMSKEAHLYNASAASFAGLMKKTKEKKIKKGSKVVCVLTGHGLKDPDTAVSVGGRMIEMEASEKKIEEYIKNII